MVATVVKVNAVLLFGWAVFQGTQYLGLLLAIAVAAALWRVSLAVRRYRDPLYEKAPPKHDTLYNAYLKSQQQ